jgi:hypothetical protein
MAFIILSVTFCMGCSVDDQISRGHIIACVVIEEAFQDVITYFLLGNAGECPSVKAMSISESYFVRNMSVSSSLPF